MHTRTKYVIFKYSAYVLLMVVLCVMQNTPGLFAIGGIKPMPLIAFAVLLAMWEGELSGGILGAVAGFLCDLYGAEKVGYTALMLFLCCVVVGLLVQSYMRGNLANAFFFTLGAALVIRGISFFFSILLPGHPGELLYLRSTLLPLCIYTALWGLLLYYPVGWLYQTFEQYIEIN